MRIVSYNVNGIRAAIRKGFVDWLRTDPADVVCIQETKAEREHVDTSVFEELGYRDYWFSARKKGYSGVAVLTRREPDRVTYGHGYAQSDEEGRVIQLEFGDTTLINAYFPSGTSGDERQGYKYRWLDEMTEHIGVLRRERGGIVLCGDYNIAHTEIDIHDPKGNRNSSGFLPQERAWMDRFFESGWIDTLRRFDPSPGLYTWWSQRFPSVRLQNKGWRIDYINVTEALGDRLQGAAILPDVKHSDHCPVYLELDI
jgi:exodeoxyribonuclease-3